ncbi:hypothetical protein BHM03_00000284 [Ensete ventricosum]|nr:hypothetical protein BHM03_00000284 [Ensete ventricosum]
MLILPPATERYRLAATVFALTGQFRPSPADFEQYQPREGEEKLGALFARKRFLHQRTISSPHMGRRNVFPRGEKERGDVTPFFSFNFFILYYVISSGMPCVYRSIPGIEQYRAELGMPVQIGMAIFGVSTLVLTGVLVRLVV